VTASFIDALERAFDKFYGCDKPDQICIVFNYKDKVIYHQAEYLA
jgi:hypothetical protein